MLANVVGQEAVKHYFTRVFETGKLPGSILMHGPPGTGKAAAALELAKVVTCLDAERQPCGECASCRKFRTMEHPDVLLLFPVPGSAKPEEAAEERLAIAANPYRKIEFAKNVSLHIDMVREVKQRLRLHSFQGQGRVIVMLGCETMTQETANALLKSLEEPPKDVVFILTTSNLDAMLPTIVSRCQLLQFTYLSVDTITEALTTREGIPERDARFFAFIAGGSYTRAREFLKDDFARRKKLCDSILETNAAGSLDDSVTLAEEMLREYPSNEIRSVLELLVSLLKYSYELCETGAGTDSQNGSFFSIPAKAETPIDAALIESVLEEVEKFVDLQSKNVYISLILIILFFRLRKIFGNE